jgi:uncharacterized protein with FMN-binding domain
LIRRAPIVLTATAAGLGALLNFHAHPRTAALPAPRAGAAATPGTSTSKTGQTVTSDAVATRYGNVQLQVTISEGKISSVRAVQLPADEPKSSEISAAAEPLLRQSALSKQSAQVDVVSGATYTSEGYASALQSALDKAGFHAAASTSAADQKSPS